MPCSIKRIVLVNMNEIVFRCVCSTANVKKKMIICIFDIMHLTPDLICPYL